MQTSSRRYQQLQPEDRVTMASLLQQNHSLRDIAAVLNRSPSTIWVFRATVTGHSGGS